MNKFILKVVLPVLIFAVGMIGIGSKVFAWSPPPIMAQVVNNSCSGAGCPMPVAVRCPARIACPTDNIADCIFGPNFNEPIDPRNLSRGYYILTQVHAFLSGGSCTYKGDERQDIMGSFTVKSTNWSLLPDYTLLRNEWSQAPGSYCLNTGGAAQFWCTFRYANNGK